MVRRAVPAVHERAGGQADEQVGGGVDAEDEPALRGRPGHGQHEEEEGEVLDVVAGVGDDLAGQEQGEVLVPPEGGVHVVTLR
ncbi:hypothetical protein ACFSTC_28960 [Nonomuraea ferruginea]